MAIVDFIYLGEASIFQEQLENFLALAEELELNGLTGSSEETTAEYQANFPNPIVRSSESGNLMTSFQNQRQEISSDLSHYTANHY